VRRRLWHATGHDRRLCGKRGIERSFQTGKLNCGRAVHWIIDIAATGAKVSRARSTLQWRGIWRSGRRRRRRHTQPSTKRLTDLPRIPAEFIWCYEAAPFHLGKNEKGVPNIWLCLQHRCPDLPHLVENVEIGRINFHIEFQLACFLDHPGTLQGLHHRGSPPSNLSVSCCET